MTRKEPGKLSPGEMRAIDERAGELRHLQTKIEELGHTALYVGIGDNPAFNNCFTIWTDGDDGDPEQLGEHMSFTKALGFIEGVDAACKMFDSWRER